MRKLPQSILLFGVTACVSPDLLANTFSDAGGLARLEVTLGATTAPGHAIWNFSIEPIDDGAKIRAIDTATGNYGFDASVMRHVNPQGEPTVFADLNGQFPAGESAATDSQFAFNRNSLLVLAAEESSSYLRAAFTGFEPIPKTGVPEKFAHIVLPKGITGSFSGAFAVEPPDGGAFESAHFENISFGQLTTPGDYSGNGAVDAADYVVWRNTLGHVGKSLAADGNGNQQIDAGDYAVWRSTFGTTGGDSGAIEVVAVPEPSMCTLVCLALVVLRLGRMLDIRNRSSQ
jgi:hypothetical protein